MLTVADDRAPLRPRCASRSPPTPACSWSAAASGTTHDDLTAQCLAEVLGVPLRRGSRRRSPWSSSASASSPSGAALDYRADVRTRPAPGAAARPAPRPLPPAGVAPGIAAQRRARRASTRCPGVPYEFRRCGSQAAHELHEREALLPARRRARWSASSASASCRWGRCSTRRRTTCSSAASTWAGERSLVRSATAATHRPRGTGRRAGGALDARPCPCTARTAAPWTTSSPTRCAGGRHPGRGRVVHRRPARRPHHRPPGSSTTSPGGVISYAEPGQADLLGVPGELLRALRRGVRGGGARPWPRARAARAGADYALSPHGRGRAGRRHGRKARRPGLPRPARPATATQVRRRSFPGDRDTVRQFAPRRRSICCSGALPA